MRAVAAVVVGLALAAWLWTHHQRSVTEHKLAAVAGELAGRPVGVRCQSLLGELIDVQSRVGEVQFPRGRAPDHMFLTRSVCRRLDGFAGAHSHRNLDCLTRIDWAHWTLAAGYEAPCERGARDDAEALTTLAHESMHLRGFVDEAQAQCYAIQLDGWEVVRLGGTLAEGDAVAEYALALQPALPSEYQSADCHAGSRLDLTPGTPAFPTEAAPVLPPAGLRGPALLAG